MRRNTFKTENTRYVADVLFSTFFILQETGTWISCGVPAAGTRASAAARDAMDERAHTAPPDSMRANSFAASPCDGAGK